MEEDGLENIKSRKQWEKETKEKREKKESEEGWGKMGKRLEGWEEGNMDESRMLDKAKEEKRKKWK